MFKNILLASLLFISSYFNGQNPDYVFVSSGREGKLSSIFKVNLSTCQKDVIIDIDSLIYDIAYNHLTNKLVVMYGKGSLKEYDLCTNDKKDLGIYSFGNGLTFDLKGECFTKSWVQIIK